MFYLEAATTRSMMVEESTLSFWHMANWYPFLSFGVILIGVGVWWRHHISYKPRLPPGPTSLPIVGSLPIVAIDLYRSRMQLPAYLESLGRRYGPILTVNLCGSNIIVLNDYNSIKQAFQHPNLSDRPKNNLGTKLVGGDGVGISSGEIWKRQRRFTLTTFRNLGLGKSTYEELITTECKELNKELLRYGDKAFNPRIVFPNASANVICSFTFGRRYDYNDLDFQFLLNAIEQIDQRIREIGGLQLLLPLFQHIPSKRRTQLYKDAKALVEFVSKIIDEHRAVFDPEHPRDYIDIFMKEIQSSDDGLLTYGNLQGTVTGLFFAGSGTISTTMRCAIYCMLRYPEVQMAVQAELDSVVGSHRLPNPSDKNSLPYTMATLLEIQRFGSTARFGPMHVAAEDTELCGFHVPKGSYLLSNIWAVHHDPVVWPDPETFKPERFLNQEGKVEKPRQFIPFNIGRRVCLGESLAKIQLFIFFTHLLHRFTFVLPNGSPPLATIEGAKAIPDYLARAIPR